MNIQILYGKEGARSSAGIVVIVDVFRAATCASVAFAKGVKQILPVRTPEEAFALKEQFPEALIMGEEMGVKIEGFDFGNSPSELEKQNLQDKDLIQRTSGGTKGLVLAAERLGKEVEKIYFGAFTTITALAKSIAEDLPETLSIVAMDGGDTEDSYFAECLKETLEGRIIEKNTVEEYLKHHKKSAHFFDESITSHPVEDFSICTDVDRYDFAVEVKRKEEGIYLFPAFASGARRYF